MPTQSKTTMHAMLLTCDQVLSVAGCAIVQGCCTASWCARHRSIHRLHAARNAVRRCINGHQCMDEAKDNCARMMEPDRDGDPDGSEWICFRALNTCANILHAIA